MPARPGRGLSRGAIRGQGRLTVGAERDKATTMGPFLGVDDTAPAAFKRGTIRFVEVAVDKAQ